MLDSDLDCFYRILGDLVQAGRVRRLSDCHGRMSWPERGVYFFFEPGEVRKNGSPRVVRIGTHAVSQGSRTRLWQRLSQHRGTSGGVGNHRGSIFRLHVGGALLDRDKALNPEPGCWGFRSSAPSPEARIAEEHVERAVSAHIGNMPFTWVAINDAPSRSSDRRHIEINSIALLAAAHAAGLEAASPDWLGRFSRAPEIRRYGLWNIDGVSDPYSPTFLDKLAALVGGGV